MKAAVLDRALEAAKQGLTHYLVPPMKAVLGPLDRLLDSAPSWVGQACAVSLFVIVGLSLFALKHEYVYQGAPDQSRWRDLRIWAWLAMIPFVAVYIFFR